MAVLCTVMCSIDWLMPDLLQPLAGLLRLLALVP
jgi:hypothetical protein